MGTDALAGVLGSALAPASCGVAVPARSTSISTVARASAVSVRIAVVAARIWAKLAVTAASAVLTHTATVILGGTSGVAGQVVRILAPGTSVTTIAQARAIAIYSPVTLAIPGV